MSKAENKTTRGGNGPACGFTLIELLVVIAIIAILAAILFPVFARARENARRASCQSNLKQIGLGIVQYTQDYDETFPMMDIGYSGSGNAWVNPAATLLDELDPYLKSRQIWICPSHGALNYGNQNLTRSSDYGYNGGLLGMMFPVDGCSGSRAYAAKVSAINQTARTIMMSDRQAAVIPASAGVSARWANSGDLNPDLWSDWALGTPAGDETNLPYLSFPQDNYIGGPLRTWGNGSDGHSFCGNMNFSWPAPRHLNTGNILYVDGHVKIRRIVDIVTHPCGDALNEYCNQS